LNRNFAIAAVLAIVGLFASNNWAQQQQQATRGIERVAENLYRAQNNGHYTVFLVTSDGIIMSDPINREFATWLKGELRTRFNVPVRYVLYTHHHWDHASGGQVFADTAQFVGHSNMPAALAILSGNVPLPEDARKLDASNNGRIERSEATGQFQNNFALFDENKDGALSGAEVARGPVGDVHPPTVTFSDRHTVTLGGKSVVMVHVGIGHSPDMTVLHFPAERVLFGTDLIQVKRIPGDLVPTLGAQIDSMEKVASLDFDVVAPGHGMIGTKADITACLKYLKDLATGVAAGIGSGKSIRDLQASLTMDDYKTWDRYDTNRTLHIAHVYSMMTGSPD